MQEAPGTYNGAFIMWYNQYNKVIFQREENPNYDNGPHYHIKDNPALKSIYYYPIQEIPNPHAAIYFGGR